MKKSIIAGIILSFFCLTAYAAPPKNQRSKFYDFSEQLINGQIRKPTVLYTNTREKVKFERLLSLKKSFLNRMFETSKYNVFK